MGRGINNFKITKEVILKNISQEKIFSIYFNLPIEIINHAINTGELICSPIRTDIHPTCGFRYNNKGQLKFRDFSGYFWGDCFDAAALIISNITKENLNINNKEHFRKVLRHIAYTFKDIIFGTEKDIYLIEKIHTSINNIKNKKYHIELVIREWNNYDKFYWDKFGVNFHWLNINFVYPVEQYYIDRNINPEPKYYYNSKDPCYAYFLGKDKNGIDNIKLYFPYRDKNKTRFITNANHLEGIYNLNRNDYNYIIITKSSKDRLSLSCNWMSVSSLYGQFNKIKIGFINIPHETYKLRNIEYRWLTNKLTNDGIIITFMDNDRTGMREAYYFRKEFNFPAILIPKKLNYKDFSEFCENNSFEIVQNKIIEITNNIINDENNKYLKYKKEVNIEPF